MWIRSRAIRSLALVVVLLGVCATAWATDITLFVTSDTHFTGTGLPANDKVCIQAMNGLAGKKYPFGSVGRPFGVITCGDLCDGGSGIPASDTPSFFTNRNYQDQWNGFNYYFSRDGVTGNSNRLKYPNFATAGNHDFYDNFGTGLSGESWYVADRLKERYGLDCNSANGNVYYSWDADGVHFVSLGRWTDTYVLDWLAGDLAALQPNTPVVLYLHYAFDDGELWYTDEERQMLADVINGYRVIAILHGHTHSSAHYVWNGYDIYDDGSVIDGREFGVLRITDGVLSYAQYQAKTDRRGNWAGGSWRWTHSKVF